MLKILGGFAAEALVTALTTYGLIALATVVFPSLGRAENLWDLVPIIFVVQFALKLVLSRDPEGKLKPTDVLRKS